MAQLRVYGHPETAEPLSARELYTRAGFSNKTPIRNLELLLGNLPNGVQARVDYLTHKRGQKLERQSLHLAERRMEGTLERQKEVDRKLDHIWELANKERAMTTRAGAPVLDFEGNKVTEVVSLKTLVKVAELQGIDAGMFVRLSRTGTIEDEWNDLTDAAIVTQMLAMMSEMGLEKEMATQMSELLKGLGLQVVPIEEDKPTPAPVLLN